MFLAFVMLGCGGKATVKPSEPDMAIHDSEWTEESDSDSAISDTTDTAQPVDTAADTASDTGETVEPCEPPVYEPNPFVTSVVSYEPGLGAGFGQDDFPDIVYGPPKGLGENAGGLDVLSLGQNGSIVLAFEGPVLDGSGADVIIFENAFTSWSEPAIVSASLDGATWFEWPCELEDETRLYEGCAGVTPVLSHPDNCIDARVVGQAGGDAFDLAVLGLSEALYIRIQDAGVSGPGGFDLDAAARVH